MLARIRMHGWRRHDAGAAAVEFALVVPILVALVFGIMQYGWYFYVANNTSSTAREAARRVVVGDCWGASFETFVKNQSPTTTSAVYTPTDLAPAAVKVGDAVTVTVKANGAIINFFPMPNGGVVTRSFTARLEDKTAGSCS